MVDYNTDFVFVLYSRNGIFNQICSMQQFVGWATHYKNYNTHLVYDRSFPPIQDPQEQLSSGIHFTRKINMPINNDPIINFLDLDLNSLYDLQIHNNNHFIKDRLNVNMIDSGEHFVVCSEASEEDKSLFGNGRKEVIIKENMTNYFDVNLSWYSIYFMNRSAEMDRQIKKVKFKSEYLEIADKISKDIGIFNGTHMRLMKDHNRVYKNTKELIEEAFSRYDNTSLPIVVSTDSYRHELLESFDVLYIDEIILDNYYKDFMSLSNNSAISLAVISALIMCNSEDFIGTPRSTYTAYINQQRAIKGIEKWKFFKDHWYDMYDPNLKYSWRSMGVPFPWERDYAECILNIED